MLESALRAAAHVPFVGGRVKAYLGARKQATLDTVFRSLTRVQNFSLAFELTKGVEGAIVECGVGSGVSLAMLALLRKVHAPDKRIFAFDTFRSFPPGYVQNQDPNPRDMLPVVRRNLATADVDAGTVTFVQGPFTETLSRGFPHGPISILHIDVDVGRSFTEVLAALWDHVASGGVVIFDEYHAASLKAWPDSKPAIDAFLAGKQFTVVDGPGLTRFMVRKQ